MTQSHLSGSGAIDEADREIIDLLRQDGRMSFSEIAKRLNLPETTARYRVQRLLQQEIVRVVAGLNPEKTGKPHFMIVWFEIENNQMDSVTEIFAQMDEVQFLAVVAAGRYTLMVELCFGVHAELVAFFDRVHQIPGVRDYESHLVLHLLKVGYRYALSPRSTES